MNKVILIGRLARDPELRTTTSNISVATFTVAVNRPITPQNEGDNGADFISCVVWRRAAENLVKYCHKGSQIAVEGRIQTRKYTTQDGTKRYATEVLVDNLTFLGTKDSTPQLESSTSQLESNTPQDPFKDFGEEIVLREEDLPF